MGGGFIHGNSSVGRALVSKTRCREFEPLFPCQTTSVMFKKIFNYCKESYNELVHKTTWPSRSELINSAMVVLAASLLIAVAVFCMDFVFQNVMELIYNAA